MCSEIHIEVKESPRKIAGMTSIELKEWLLKEYGILIEDIEAQYIITIAKRELLRKALERQIERKHLKKE